MVSVNHTGYQYKIDYEYCHANSDSQNYFNHRQRNSITGDAVSHTIDQWSCIERTVCLHRYNMRYGRTGKNVILIIRVHFSTNIIENKETVVSKRTIKQIYCMNISRNLYMLFEGKIFLCNTTCS